MKSYEKYQSIKDSLICSYHLEIDHKYINVCLYSEL